MEKILRNLGATNCREFFFGSEGKNGKTLKPGNFLGRLQIENRFFFFKESSTTTVHHMNWFQLAGGFIPILLNFRPETLGLHDPIFR